MDSGETNSVQFVIDATVGTPVPDKVLTSDTLRDGEKTTVERGNVWEVVSAGGVWSSASRGLIEVVVAHYFSVKFEEDGASMHGV